MIALGAVAAALLAVPVGLFLNVVIDRVPAKQPLLPLPPLRSLLSPARYPLVILATAALFAGTVLRFRGDWVIPAYLVFFASLVAISVIDFQLQIIPNRIVYPTIFASVPLLALAALAGDQWERFGHALMGASAAWTALFVICMIKPAGMGFGDVRLSFVLGLFLGWIRLGYVFSGLFMGVVLLSVVGVTLAALRLKRLQDHIAFGPFLAGGAILVVFAGQPITRALLGA